MKNETILYKIKIILKHKNTSLARYLFTATAPAAIIIIIMIEDRRAKDQTRRCRQQQQQQQLLIRILYNIPVIILLRLSHCYYMMISYVNPFLFMNAACAHPSIAELLYVNH